MRGGFRRRGPEIDLELGETEADILGLALAVLEGPAGSEMRSPRFRAHPGDHEAEARFRELTAGSLEAGRRMDRQRFSTSLDRGTLSAADAAAWLRVLAEARLALARRLGVADEGWDQAPPTPGLALLHLFGSVQDELAGLLLGSR